MGLPTLASELAKHDLNLVEDHVNVVEDDDVDGEDERNDALGDLPNWEDVSLSEFLTEYYYTTRHTPTGGWLWHVCETRYGDGYWDGNPSWKGDGPAESIDQAAHQDGVMNKFFNEEEVQRLTKLIQQGLEYDDASPKEAAGDALEVVYRMARSRRVKYLNENQNVVKRLLRKIKSNHSVLNFCGYAEEFTKEVREKAVAAQDPAAYRKECRDAFIISVCGMLEIDKLYGTPWKWFNSLYWNYLFNWINKEPCQLLSECTVRYAFALNYYNNVHGVETAPEEGSLW